MGVGLVGLVACGASAQPGARPGVGEDGRNAERRPAGAVDGSGNRKEEVVDVGGPCTTAAECVVVPAIAGWAEYPREGVSCADACYAAILVSQREVWLTEKARIEPQIPCTKKRAKCGDMGALVASCQAGRCGLVAAP